VSLEPVNLPGGYRVRRQGVGSVVLAVPGDAQARADASFVVRSGLTVGTCISFESVNAPGYFLARSGLSLALARQNVSLFLGVGATFCPVAGAAGQYSFQALGLPGTYLRHQGLRMGLAWYDGSASTRLDMTFAVRPAPV
jgi:hypothetical protein